MVPREATHLIATSNCGDRLRLSLFLLERVDVSLVNSEVRRREAVVAVTGHVVNERPAALVAAAVIPKQLVFGLVKLLGLSCLGLKSAFPAVVEEGVGAEAALALRDGSPRAVRVFNEEVPLRGAFSRSRSARFSAW